MPVIAPRGAAGVDAASQPDDAFFVAHDIAGIAAQHGVVHDILGLIQPHPPAIEQHLAAITYHQQAAIADADIALHLHLAGQVVEAGLLRLQLQLRLIDPHIAFQLGQQLQLVGKRTLGRDKNRRL